MRKMAALCQAVGSFLRPAAASSSAGASRPGRGVTRSLAGLAAPRGPAQRSYDQVHSVGFPPVPPPGVALGGRGASAVPARAYADDYGGGTMNQTSDYGGGTMNQASTPSPPTVEWDPRNTNTVTVIGNTGMDPEMTMFDTGACVARVSLAVRGKKPMNAGDPMGTNADDGATTWLDVEAWNDEARQLCDHVAKGRQIQVTGRLKENVWTDKATGQRRSRIKVSAYSFAFVAPYNGANGVNGVNGGVVGADPYANAAVPATPYQQQQRPPPQQRAPAPATTMGGYGGDAVGEKDDLWREVLDNPDAWWDNRERKSAPGGNPRYPDFKHKETQTPLWIESRDTPRWAIDALVGGGGGAMAGVGGGAQQQQQQQQPGTDADGFEPYYAGGGSVPGGGGGYGDLAGSGAGSVDYSRPYGDVAYEPAKPFDDDEPPF